MPFTTSNITSLEGTTFKLPVSVVNKTLNDDLELIINWGDGSKERVTGLQKIGNFMYYKEVPKKYTFPGTYNISIEAKRQKENPLADGLLRCGSYNMTVFPTTLSFAPSSNFILTDLSADNRVINLYLDDSGIPHNFNNKVLNSIVRVQNSGVDHPQNLTLTYTPNTSGRLTISASTNFINSLVLNTVYYYAITETFNGSTSMILQGNLRKISNSANGITVS
jgi:hypothetical protein